MNIHFDAAVKTLVPRGDFTANVRRILVNQTVRISILAILAFALCSCADFKGFHLKRGDCGDNIRGHDCGAEGDGE